MISSLAALVLLAVLAGFWLLSVFVRDASIIDVFWGPGFALVAGVCAATRGTALDPWRMLLLVMVTVWGLRLGLYLARRNLSREHLAARDGSGEDRRYQAMRARIGPRFWLISLGTVFALQGCLLFVVSLPIQTALLGTTEISGLRLAPAIIGVALWAVGLLFEAVGDAQLARFKADPANAGQVMDRGLWRYTRHPNYFGDFLIWWGHFAVAAALGAPWWTAVGPVIMSILLTRVSGVPLLERDLRKRRAGYEEYVRRTSAFFPRPPRSESN
ncbi:MAG: DUF1295 domain-containing protein [Myxococcales bacterium]|nr:DUF1295 domain-containing protein [Myxococcales bacterium]